ncbi:isoaspartyl peptidase/L-asparaginase-like isoform X2 [Halichondria panicea]|uniref:isoaspartyl peptidase/L-asparaginase-like isoform X2 n=1 Tax=Halichondria panicea TaxID=6063 RepID=UPI00312B9042
MAAVIVHAGAYDIPDHEADPLREGCKKAAQEAHKALTEGKSAVDAVELAVCVLEDHPLMDAGHGSVLNAAGEVEMDAIITDGSSLNFGSVAGVRNISHPISLARMVMDDTPHVMLIGVGANLFAKEKGVPEVDPDELVTAEAKEAYQTFKQYSSVVDNVFNIDNHLGHDTVGAVAIDLCGNIAAGTSTGGISLKRVGRVGDCPLIGCGAIADSGVGGISCTGHGESIAKVLLAQRSLSTLQAKNGIDAEGALSESLGYMLDRVGGRGGAIMVTKEGCVARHYTTKGMAWASVSKTGQLDSGI